MSSGYSVRKLETLHFFALTALLLLTLSASASAELLVSRVVRVNGVAVGAKLSDDFVFSLPDNSEIDLLKSPDNSPFVMRGPYKGTLNTFIKNCSGLLASVHKYCRNAGGDQLPVGGAKSR
jgi:hypothetical protein